MLVSIVFSVKFKCVRENFSIFVYIILRKRSESRKATNCWILCTSVIKGSWCWSPGVRSRGREDRKQLLLGVWTGHGVQRQRLEHQIVTGTVSDSDNSVQQVMSYSLNYTIISLNKTWLGPKPRNNILQLDR